MKHNKNGKQNLSECMLGIRVGCQPSVVVAWEVGNSPQRKQGAEFDCVPRTEILKVQLKEQRII